jgi:hypothetical protein
MTIREAKDYISYLVGEGTIAPEDIDLDVMTKEEIIEYAENAMAEAEQEAEKSKDYERTI